jgi:probable phosphomutase (TIGR03848 family)
VTTVLLVRHGQTDAIDRYIAGTADGTSLNRTGRLQAEALAERLRDLPLAAVASSPLTRTRETAEPIARSHGLDIEFVPAFGEFEFGDWTGRSFQELDADPQWHRFNGVRSLTRAPQGELMLDVQRRAVSALLEMADARPDARVVVVSHGDVIRAALMYFLGMPLDHVHRLEISAASISIVTLDANGPVVRQVNGDSGVPAS